MRKTVVAVVLLSLASLIALRLARAGDEPALAGQWQELRPPDFE